MIRLNKYTQPETRAYSVLRVKASESNDGTIIGIASTPELDRAGDVLLPQGAKFRTPLPLLWQHDHSKPIGHVTSAKATSRGIEIVAKIAVGATEEIDRAYALIRRGLVQGLSVGFRALEEPERTPTGYLYRSWEMMELSAVTLPCNAGATITSVKAACGVRVESRSVPLVNVHRGAVKLISTGGAVKLRSNRGAVKLIKGSVRLVRSR